jgi:hypothetical protein
VVISVPQGKAGDTRAWIPQENRTTATEETVEVFG